MTSSDPRPEVPAVPSELITFGEVRTWLAVSENRAQVITADRRLAFPDPWYVSENGRVRLWRRSDVEAWLDANRPGWRGTAS